MIDYKLNGSFQFLLDGRNGRVYSKEIIRKAVDEFNESIKDGRTLGEFEHPDNLQIELGNVSHKVNHIDLNDDMSYTAELTVLDTPKGKILQQSLDYVKASARCIGDDDSIEIVTIDTQLCF